MCFSTWTADILTSPVSDLLLRERPAQGTKERLLLFKYKETEAPIHHYFLLFWWLLVFHIKTKLSCYLSLKISIFNILEKILFFLFYYCSIKNILKIHFISEERDFIVLLFVIAISVVMKQTITIYVLLFEEISYICFQIKVLKHKLRISILFIFKHCFMFPFSLIPFF